MMSVGPFKEKKANECPHCKGLSGEHFKHCQKPVAVFTVYRSGETEGVDIDQAVRLYKACQQLAKAGDEFLIGGHHHKLGERGWQVVVTDGEADTMSDLGLGSAKGNGTSIVEAIEDYLRQKSGG